MIANTKSNMEAKEISLSDLIVEILLKWRLIVVVMLIGGVLFAGLSYVQSYKNAEAQKQLIALKQQEIEQMDENNIEDVDKKWLEEQLTEVQLNNVNNVVAYEQMYEEKRAYNEKLLAMNVDPFNLPKAEITFLIQSDDLDKTYNIQKVYEDLATGTSVCNYIEENCETTYAANELLFLERTSYGEQSGHDIVRLYIIHDDAEVCQEIANCVVEYVLAQQERLVEVLGEHQIVLLEQSFGIIKSDSHLNLQKNAETELINLRNSYVALKSKFTDVEWYYYNYLTTGKAAENPDADKVEEKVEEQPSEQLLAIENVPDPSISVKYVILGIILFAFVYVFYAFMKYIFNNKLRSTESLVNIYNLPQLGLIPITENKKKFLGFVDTWILSLRDRNKRKFTTEEAINMAAVAVKMATKKVSSSEVYLVGCDVKNQTADVCEKINNILSKDGIETKVLDNVLYNAESMADLEHAHCVVLVEKAGSTLYEEVAKELELLVRQDITVLGGIVVE